MNYSVTITFYVMSSRLKQPCGGSYVNKAFTGRIGARDMNIYIYIYIYIGNEKLRQTNICLDIAGTIHISGQSKFTNGVISWKWDSTSKMIQI